MRRLTWLLPLAFFFLNPGFACGPAEPQYKYGAEEMRAAVEGVWSFTIMPEGGGGAMQLSVKIEQAATAPAAHAAAPGRTLVRAAYACGGRTLVKSAGACIDWTEMPLTVTYLAGDPSFANATLSGTFVVNGTEFVTTITDLELVLGGYHITSQLSPGGTLVNPRISPAGTPGTLTIVTRG
jgi:hypothetical protein